MQPKTSLQFDADLGFFTQLLCRDGETLDDYAEMFDFSLPAVKRAAVAKIRGEFASAATRGVQQHQNPPGCTAS